ncbi:PIG-L deacetylase family protein [Nocardioides taihuensis]|uniref:PIG-L deacetylase family protein n=1 Tax=Nocardioides taihuensis TaxID=1835606 RepID=A0ABW0BRW3_9ACTN
MTLVHGPVLGVWAHPDDEAYLSAGVMALARDAGHRVVVATATWGEHGTDDPRGWPPRRLAALRERELTASLAAVGVEEHRHLGHDDGRCRPEDQAGVDAIAALLDEVQPALVLTFGPDGMTGHSDHQAISAWTTRAWHATGRRAALWYATLTPDYYRRWGGLSDRVGLWMGKERPCTPPERLALSLRCEGGLLERKRQALAAHASQTAGLRTLVGAAVYDSWWSEEFFVTADADALRATPAA